MKKTITLTKMLALAIMLVTFTTAIAASGDDGCKTKCCKEKKEKEMKAALAELERAMNKLEAELKTFTAVMITTEVKQSFQNTRIVRVRPAYVMAFAPAETTAVESKYKINFDDLNKEMDKEQEKMTTAPDMSQKIDFSNLNKEMDEVQQKMSSLNG